MNRHPAGPKPNPQSPTMRASLLHGIRDLRLEELARPTPGPDEVLLQVACVGVCGSDVHYYQHGRIGSQVVEEPIIMGHEFSACVVGLGSAVSSLELGQLVAIEPGISCGQCEPCLHGHPNLCPAVRFCGTPPIDGVFAEYTVMPADNCFPLPDGMSAVEGAMLEPLGIAIHSVDLGHLKAGQTVAVLGAGPIGLLIAAAAKAAGASEIYVTEPLAYRRQFALDYIADVALDPETQDVVDGIRQLTAGRGVDVAFEAAGAPDTPQQAAAVTRIGGKVVIAGIPPDGMMVMRADTVRHKGLTIKIVRRMKHTYPRAIRLVQSGMVDVKPLATHLLPLERISEAFEMVAGYRDGVLRAVIRVSE
ncbi:MAG: NAD(P)-dependent alcohol dehydrogenase [Anaerolineae bacterium]